MANEIRTSLGAALDVGATLWGGVDDCLSFRLLGLSADIPVPASSDHDGRLGNTVASSLACLAQLIGSDVALVRGMDDALRGIDARMGAGMRGGGS
ncbi:MAG: hypothetical protein IKG22_13530 [Atopobiaceae bacterium]|nr:hypothetical protein [Atopobiaceae bacterium]